MWILPLVALCIGGWLIYSSVRDDGVDITVRFEDATGIVAGKTQVVFKGIPVGLVKRVEVDRDLKQVVATIEMVKESKGHLVEDMRFWIVKPEVSASRVTGLETIVGGSYIAVMPGKSKSPAREFEGLTSAPPLSADTPGLRLRLLSENTATLKIASPVYYRSFKVGEVVAVGLTADNSQIAIDILLYERYRSLVNSTTVFWNASGLSLRANLSRVQLQMDSLTSLLSGGIALDTRQEGGAIDPAKPLTLHATKNDAILSRGARLTFHFKAMEGVNPGAAVRYRGVDIGEIVSVDLDDDLQSLTAVGYAYPQAEALFKDRTYVWMVTPRFSLRGVDNLDTAVRGNYLTLEPGGETPRTEFTVHSQPPPVRDYPEGLTIRLQAERPDSLTVGSPVTFRQVPIGRVLHIELAPDARSVDIFVGIDRAYAPLVRESSQFWNASGIRVSGGLMTKLNVATESIEALVRGGIAMAVPEEDPGRPVASGHRFQLLAKPPKGWEQWRLEVPLATEPAAQD